MKQLIVFIALAFLFSGCDKNEAPAYVSPLNYGAYIISSYKYSPEIDYNNDGVLETECYPFLSYCKKDNIYGFSSDHEGYILYGINYCRNEGEGDFPIYYNYKFIDNNKRIIIDNYTLKLLDTVSINIIDLNNYEIPFKVDKGNDKEYYTVTVRYTHK